MSAIRLDRVPRHVGSHFTKNFRSMAECLAKFYFQSNVLPTLCWTRQLWNVEAAWRINSQSCLSTQSPPNTTFIIADVMLDDVMCLQQILTDNVVTFKRDLITKIIF